MEGLFWLVVLIAVAYGLVQLVGRLLPGTYTVERSTQVQATPSALWAIVVNHAREKDWRNDLLEIDRVSSPSASQAVWKEKRRDGAVLQLKTLESEAPKKLVREIVNSKELGGTYTYVIKPVGEASCELKVTEVLQVRKPWQRIKLQLLSKKTDLVDRYLDDVKQRAVTLKEVE